MWVFNVSLRPPTPVALLFVSKHAGNWVMWRVLQPSKKPCVVSVSCYPHIKVCQPLWDHSLPSWSWVWLLTLLFSQDVLEEKDMGQQACVFSIAQFISVLGSTLLNRHGLHSFTTQWLLELLCHELAYMFLWRHGSAGFQMCRGLALALLAFTPSWLLTVSLSQILATDLKHMTLLPWKLGKWHIGRWLYLGSKLAPIHTPICWFERFPCRHVVML